MSEGEDMGTRAELVGAAGITPDIPGAEFKGSREVYSTRALEDAAAELDCDVPALLALIHKETRGHGFGHYGRVAMLYEGHVFNRQTAGRFLRPEHKDFVWRRFDRSRYGAPPHGPFTQLEAAIELDRAAALRSASWGLPQIMGFNHKLAGYDTVEAMVEDFKTGENAQLRALVRFLQASGIDKPLRMHDAEALATRYNGKAQAQNNWAADWRKLYKRFSRDRGEPGAPYRIVRLGQRGEAVRRLQELLGEAGFHIRIDGEFGGGTLEAVEQFQAKHGLAVDGVVGARTWAALGAEQVGPIAVEPPKPKVIGRAGKVAAGGTLTLFGVLQWLEETGSAALETIVNFLSAVPPPFYGVALLMIVAALCWDLLGLGDA